jgi:probable HAF family extracellular repeat protein
MKSLGGQAVLLAFLLTHSSTFGGVFIPLGDLPGSLFRSSAHAISADGSTVVGSGYSPSGFEAFTWTQAGGMQGLGYLPGGSGNSNATGLSADGSAVSGTSRTSSSPSTATAARWHNGTPFNLGAGSETYCRDISDDGTVLVGYGNGAFRWTSATGAVGLGGSSTRAWAVSGNGLTVVGDRFGTEAFRWTQAGGMVALGDLPGGSVLSAAYGVSTDGSVIVGESISASGTEAFIWTTATGIVGLGDLPGGIFSSEAHDVSGDGRVVVGNGRSVNGTEAFVWDQINGMRTVQEALGPDGFLMDGWTSSVAFGVADDGVTLVGYGTNPDGNQEAWYAVIPEPSTLALLSVALLAWRRERRTP